MKREIHGSTDVTSHFIEQTWVLVTATTQDSEQVNLGKNYKTKNEGPLTEITLNN